MSCNDNDSLKTYIVLFRIDQERVGNFKGKPEWLTDKDWLRELDAEVEFYFVTGEYDVIAIVKALNEEVAAKIIEGVIERVDDGVAVMLRAFSEEEYFDIPLSV